MSKLEPCRIKPFDPKRVSFGRHETFSLRFGWLTKGFQALKVQPDVFGREDATVTLGVGKNMVNSIRYWLQAARIAERAPFGMETTDIGECIFGEEGWDPYLEDEATIWLVHWLLVTNPEIATAWYWFFSHFHKPEFTGQEVQTALCDFAKDNISVKTSPTTLKSDAALILRMYVKSKGSTRIPLEDALDSPLSMLRLISRHPDSRSYESKPDIREDLPIGVLGYAVSELFDQRGVEMIPLDELMYGKFGFPAPGSVFRLTENALIAKLERLVKYLPGKFVMRDTAGIHQLYRNGKVKAIKYLEKHYRTATRGAAA